MAGNKRAGKRMVGKRVFQLDMVCRRSPFKVMFAHWMNEREMPSIFLPSICFLTQFPSLFCLHYSIDSRSIPVPT